MSPEPVVSIVIPCRNEERFIGACLDSVFLSDFPKQRLETLVVDGMSDDGTRGIVARKAASDASVKLLDNPAGTTPAAMNIGIRSAKGAIIVRLDAHCVYPPSYLSSVVAWLEKSGADNVGGVCRTRPANETAKAWAIALAVSHPFGVGNSYFRIGVSEPRWVDTVPFGCYRREVFDRIGLFDEELVRNQDDELNTRLVRQGGRILLVPTIVADYFARESLAKLWRMYYQYGYFKPLVARKVGAITTVRQVLPTLLVTGVALGAVVIWLFPMLRLPYALALLVYLGGDVVSAAHAARTRGIRCALWLTAVFPVLHAAYGLGFLKGLADFIVRRRRPDVRIGAMAPSR